MNPRVIILIVVALAIAGGSAILVQRLMKRQVETQVAEQVEEKTTAPAAEVLIAAADIKTGQLIGEDDLRWEVWPEKLIDPRFVVRRGDQGANPRDAFIGGYSRKSMIKGEPVQAEFVFRQDKSGVMAGMLSPGMRAISVQIEPHTAAAGFILPGDRVDIIATYKVELERGSSFGSAEKEVRRTVAETILRNVRVLAIDQTVREPEGEKATQAGRNVTVEVTPKQAEGLLVAVANSNNNRVTLSLRSLAPGPRDLIEPDINFTSELSVLTALWSGAPLAPGGNIFVPPEESAPNPPAQRDALPPPPPPPPPAPTLSNIPPVADEALPPVMTVYRRGVPGPAVVSQ